MSISLYEPFLQGNEKRYVNDCLDSNWISSKGKYVSLFEKKFLEYTGSHHAVAVSNGTVAIHLALAGLGIGPGDEVLVPTFTYIASVNPIIYVGATPVFVDSCADNWQMNLDDLESKLTVRTRAVIAVHLYGCICNITRLSSFCQKHNLFLIEDCAEALGSIWEEQHVGTFGQVGCFSFFGNKTVTTGEGGMVIAEDEQIAKRIVHLKGQGVCPEKYYWHDTIGFNYRMTNIQAAIGLAQMENIEEILKRKRRIAEIYRKEFEQRHLPLKMLWEDDSAQSGFWMATIGLKDTSRRDSLISNLKLKYRIETRPAFYPVHTMPMYEKFGSEKNFPVAEHLSAGGMNLPSFPTMSMEQQMVVINALSDELEAC